MAKSFQAGASPALQRIVLGMVLLVAAGGLLSGCQTDAPATNQALFDQDYARRHPVVLSNEPETLDVPVGMNAGALSAQLRAPIRDYARAYRREGTGALNIQVPTGAANDIAAAEMGKSIHYALIDMGVPRTAIRIAPYPVDDPAKLGVLRLSYLKLKAMTPQCGIWPDDMVAHSDNRDTYDLGCASQNNFAAMVADPADLVRPRPVQAADGARRAAVITDYEKGTAIKPFTTQSTGGGS
ncbi:CpaD family pilus assembly protein [Faunimonas pinastri]|nr:CpaD family pilus assembly protein [Faunimonas pinastri]